MSCVRGRQKGSYGNGRASEWHGLTDRGECGIGSGWGHSGGGEGGHSIDE